MQYSVLLTRSKKLLKIIMISLRNIPILDFSKAFDTFGHNIMLIKFEYNGIRGVVKDCFSSYVSNKPQAVSLHRSVISDMQTVFLLGASWISPGATLFPYLYI